MKQVSRSAVAGTILALAGLGGCSKESKPVVDAAPSSVAAAAPADLGPLATPNQRFAAGRPTFVLGTAGDDVQDRRIATQVGLLRGLALPDSEVVPDASIDLAAGVAAWPTNPVLYGGPAENSVFGALAPSLGVSLSATELVLGGERFEGEGIRFVAAVPAAAARPDRPGHPAFVVFAGTGAGGVAEINANLPLDAPILVADRFGALAKGMWVRDAATGAWRPKLDPARGRRIAYRTEVRRLAAPAAEVRFHFPAMVPPRATDKPAVDACVRGIEAAAGKLGLTASEPLDVFIYPDRRSKAGLTGSSADGHAVPSSRTLHVLAFDPSPGGGLESLVAHEATHVLGYYGWGPAGTPLLGEGLAVWVAGGYQGKTLSQWRGQLTTPPSLEQLLGTGWKQIPEATKYPLAGLFVEAALAEVGATNLRDHLLSAAPDSWSEACARAGTTAQALQAALARKLASAP